MERIAVVDADLIGRKKHRFPNLACMKLSGYHKGRGDDVALKTDYEGLDKFDRVYLSKVFTDTEVPEGVLGMGNVSYGGTGFFYDRAPSLPGEAEHCMPDYHLYDGWVQEKLDAGAKRSDFQFYLDYSIGFLTRGCFRKCAFCVNRNYDRICMHSPLEEFLDPERKKICLLDDNFLGHPRWKEMLDALKRTGKPFQFRQGLDERLLDDGKCRELFSARYDGTCTFAFDDVRDAGLIEKKLILVRKHTDARLRFYCFCGFDREDVWDGAFWRDDVFGLLERVEILMRYGCLPYVMRFGRYRESPFRGMYVTIARWANQPGLFCKKSLREFGEMNGRQSACFKYLDDFERRFPEAAYFYDLKFEKVCALGADGRGEES